MIDPIQTSGTGPIGQMPSAGAAEAQPAGKNFMDVMLDSLDEVSRLQTEADRSVEALYTGQTDDVTSVFTAVNKAEIAFDLLMEIRNKLVEAYRDIQQIRV